MAPGASGRFRRQARLALLGLRRGDDPHSGHGLLLLVLEQGAGRLHRHQLLHDQRVEPDGQEHRAAPPPLFRHAGEVSQGRRSERGHVRYRRAGLLLPQRPFRRRGRDLRLDRRVREKGLGLGDRGRDPAARRRVALLRRRALPHGRALRLAARRARDLHRVRGRTEIPAQMGLLPAADRDGAARLFLLPDERLFQLLRHDDRLLRGQPF